MEEHPPSTDDSSATYEIRLQATPLEPLKRRFPSTTVFSTRTETVLFRCVEESTELDALLDQLQSMGLVLTEIHEVPLGRTLVAEQGAVRVWRESQGDQSL